MDLRYENTLKAVEEFKQPGGIGRKLYQRLVDRTTDPNIENWMLEISTRTIYLDRRYSLLKSNIGGSHKIRDDGVVFSQVETAAIIALTTLKYQQTFEAGEMEPEYLNELPLSTRGQEWLFNSCREPVQDVDTTNKFESNHTLVVLYRGHVFKVDLVQGGKNLTYAELKATFQAILDSVHDDSWVSILTSQERNTWAKVRHASLKTLFNHC